ncbi:MAG: HAD family phosphatase [Pseudomonadota bacterium]
MQPLPDAVIFDMDGLLIDTETYSLRGFEHAVTTHGLQDLKEVFVSLVGTNERHHTDTLQRELSHLVDPVAFRQTWVDHYIELTTKHTIPLLSGVRETLVWLHMHSVKTAVATSSTTSAAEKKLRDTEIRDFFHAVVCGDQVENSKPHPDIYLKAGQSINADMSRSIGLEDSVNGVKSAHAAGLNVIQVPNVVPPSDELLALGVTVCDSMNDVLTLLQRGEAIP